MVAIRNFRVVMVVGRAWLTHQFFLNNTGSIWICFAQIHYTCLITVTIRLMYSSKCHASRVYNSYILPSFLVHLSTNYCWFMELTLFFCSNQDLDLRCEELIKDEFGAECNFDVHDAIQKLEKLSIVHRVHLSHFFYILKYTLRTIPHF